MTENYLEYLKQKLINKLNKEDPHAMSCGVKEEYYRYYFYIEQIEHIINEFFEEEKKLVP